MVLSLSFFEISPEMFFPLSVTLFARPKKLYVGDHSCIAPLSCGDQSITGRNVVFSRILWQSSSPISHQVTLLCSTAHPHARKLHWLDFTCAGCTHQQDIKRGRGCYTLASFQLGSIITGFPRGLRKLKNPPQHCPPACPPTPRAPLVMRTPPGVPRVS